MEVSVFEAMETIDLVRHQQCISEMITDKATTWSCTRDATFKV